jgi:hypothetical protein
LVAAQKKLASSFAGGAAGVGGEGGAGGRKNEATGQVQGGPKREEPWDVHPRAGVAALNPRQTFQVAPHLKISEEKERRLQKYLKDGGG